MLRAVPGRYYSSCNVCLVMYLQWCIFFLGFFGGFFVRFSTGLVQHISLFFHSDPVGPLVHLLCRGPSQCPFSFLVAAGFEPTPLPLQCGRLTATRAVYMQWFTCNANFPLMKIIITPEISYEILRSMVKTVWKLDEK